MSAARILVLAGALLAAPVSAATVNVALDELIASGLGDCTPTGAGQCNGTPPDPPVEINPITGHWGVGLPFDEARLGGATLGPIDVPLPGSVSLPAPASSAFLAGGTGGGSGGPDPGGCPEAGAGGVLTSLSFTRSITVNGVQSTFQQTGTVRVGWCADVFTLDPVSVPINTGAGILTVKVAGAAPVVSNGPTTVSLTSPLAGTILAAPAAIPLAATAVVTIGAVDKVEFYRDATLVATLTSPPYTATDTNVPAGAHTYTARAYNAEDPNTSFLVSVATPVTVSGIVPAPSIAFRAAGDQATGTGASITPILPAGTQAGDFAMLIVAGRPTNTTQPAAPAGWTLRSSSLREAGTNDLKIMTFYRLLNGTDPNPTVTLPTAWQGAAAGMSAQIAVWTGVNPSTPFDAADVLGNTAAAASWTPPGITTVTPGAWVVSAVATSDDNALGLGAPQGFTGRMSGSSYDTTAGGDHSIGLADKTQASPGATAMPTWSQTVNGPDTWAGITFALRPGPANIAPTVNITSPANGASFSAPANITVTATATDSGGSVLQVEFFDGPTLVGTVPTIAGSTSYSVTLSNVAAGAHVYAARATDNSGAQTTSAAVSVTVTGGVAQMYFIETDHLNTPRLIENSTGTTVWRWEQGEPFGNDVPNNNPSGAGAFDFPLRFPGQYFDKEDNLAYNYYRDYDPGIDRYVESDPTGLRGGLNTYLYVRGNPLSRRDPLGLWGTGISFEFSTINPFTSGGGGSYGLNFQYTSDSGFHWYTYGTPGDVGSTGFLVGPSVQFNVATGNGPWTGDFQSINASYGPWTGGYFQSPPDQQDPGYAGISFGIGRGPAGIGATTTNYKRLFPDPVPAQCMLN